MVAVDACVLQRDKGLHPAGYVVAMKPRGSAWSAIERGDRGNVFRVITVYADESELALFNARMPMTAALVAGRWRIRPLAGRLAAEHRRQQAAAERAARDA